eukprot:gnl/MRDRNA2_/MRDRNA2_80303_c0_seq2.p1 gnl/MRDRNA2_/MRDRNA2_80303_c0~~gnl/MRDRNA2_/MRDRNA2_80303_c0_seq2.p1  ORF type:complete len:416 (+),score=90.72 gnl/MRDRNA2_/MRDRNA2_80303_c0_seq2:123-1370(+)
MFNFFSSCSLMSKAAQALVDEEDASEIQLNVFEFRNFRTHLDNSQQGMLERIVNQWAVQLVKGKTMLVMNFMEKVYLDKDLLNLEYSNEMYPLKAIRAMNFFTDDLSGAPFVLEVTFEGMMGDANLLFNFEEERTRLNFALALRVLRSRDPTLDPSQTVEITREDREECGKNRQQTFNDILSTNHFHADAGIPIVFSVSDLKLYQKLQTTSRHVYLEFFVKYPQQDQYLYAKSPTTHMPSQAVAADAEGGVRRRGKKMDEDEEEEERRREDAKKQAFGGNLVPIAAMRFDLKNVKMKIPKVPHKLFGRVMSKDDYFPTALGIFEIEVKRGFISDKRKTKDPKEKMASENPTDPQTLALEVMSAWKMTVTRKDARTGDEVEEEQFVQIGTLTIRLIGYVNDAMVGGYKGGDNNQND